MTGHSIHDIYDRNWQWQWLIKSNALIYSLPSYMDHQVQRMVVEMCMHILNISRRTMQSNPIQSYLGSYNKWNAKKWSKRTPSIHSSFRMDSKVNPRPIGHTAATGIDGATEGKCGV
eukprot:320024_1